MTPKELDKPAVPIAYAHLTLQLAEERGVSRAAMLDGLGLDDALFEQPDARVGLLTYGRMCIRAMRLSGDASLGYEFGLRNQLTTHGFYGYGLMSQATLGDALEFAVRYGALRYPGWNVRLLRDGAHAALEVRETVPFGVLRQYALDMMMVSLAASFGRAARQREPLELWFDCPEPPYYKRYQDRFPPARFEMGSNQLRFPAELLQRPQPSANAVTARLVEEDCRRELVMLGVTGNLVERVKAVLVNDHGQYPSLEAVAEQFHMSARTLKRQLLNHGLKFRDLLEEARRRDGIRLMEDPSLTVEDIAQRLGYTTPSNFSRAFKRWTGTAPGRFRSRPGSPPRRR